MTTPGQAISLRPLERGHLEKTREWANDPELMRLLNRAHPVSPEEHERWFTALQRRSDCVYFAIETNPDRQHVGNVWLWDLGTGQPRAELRIVVGETTHTGRGLGTEAILLACEYAFEHLELHQVYAYVLTTNPRAKRAFEKAGFAVEETLKDNRWSGDRYVDVFLLAKPK
jgi:diamine N-acetyltransferase